MGEIAGYPVRPGYFEDFGATLLPVGVNFTVHTYHGTSCELLLFHKGEEEPYAVLPFSPNHFSDSQRSLRNTGIPKRAPHHRLAIA